MQCPKCSDELFEVEQSPVTLDCCPGCHGLWFDRGELEKITGLDDAVKTEAGPTDAICPRCHQPMHEHRTGDAGVLVERCPACGGIWLDRGELEALRKRERPSRRARGRSAQKPERKVLTLKEFLLEFIDSSIDRLGTSP